MNNEHLAELQKVIHRLKLKEEAVITVYELCEKLQSFPPDEVVWFPHNEGGYLEVVHVGYQTEHYWDDEGNKKEEKLLVLDCDLPM